jgi:hypothetical protein
MTHILEDHLQGTSSLNHADIKDLVEKCEVREQHSSLEKQNCLFCEKLITGSKKIIQRHIGHHLEEIALKALPPQEEDSESEPENELNSKTTQGRQRLSRIVKAAVSRCAAVGKPDIGNAIKRLYDASLNNARLAELLDAVLAEKARPDQVQEFKSYVRNARENPDSDALDHDQISNIDMSEFVLPPYLSPIGELAPPTLVSEMGARDAPVTVSSTM